MRCTSSRDRWAGQNWGPDAEERVQLESGSLLERKRQRERGRRTIIWLAGETLAMSFMTPKYEWRSIQSVESIPAVEEGTKEVRGRAGTGEAVEKWGRTVDGLLEEIVVDIADRERGKDGVSFLSEVHDRKESVLGAALGAATKVLARPLGHPDGLSEALVEVGLRKKGTSRMDERSVEREEAAGGRGEGRTT